MATQPVVRAHALATEPFNLAAALTGAPFICVHDLRRADAARFITTTIHFIDDSKHPAYAVYCGEWLVYEDESEMDNTLRMVKGHSAERR